LCVDAGGEDRHLHFGRAGIGRAARVVFDDIGLDELGHCEFLDEGNRMLAMVLDR
jgi:hypothetical protein